MPRQGTARIVKQLANMSVIYKNAEYIHPQFMLNVPVIKDTDKYVVYNSEFRLPETLRANGAPANQVTWEMSHNSYYLEKHSLKDVVTNDDRDNSDAPVNLDVDTTEYLTDKILMRMEYETMKLLFTTTTFSNNATLTSATSWRANTTTSVPIQNALSASTYMVKQASRRPNAVIMGLDPYDALKENSNVYDRFKYVQKSILTKDLLASLFDVANVYVGEAIYDQGKEGGTESQTTIWGGDALFAYFHPRMQRKMATAAVMMRNMRYGNPYVVKKWYEDDIDGDWIEVTTKAKPKAVATSCGYLYKSVSI